MLLKYLFLQNFRNYQKATFDFNNDVTLIIGPNTAGKSNLIESIVLLSRGKSFRAQKDIEMIRFGEEVGRIKGETQEGLEKVEELEVVLSTGVLEEKLPSKRFLVNKVPKRRVDFSGILPTVLFSPEDLNLVSGSPSLRREFLDTVLEQTDRDYRFATISYTKALRQRNAVLDLAQKTGSRYENQFEYWDNLLIQNGSLITQKREALIQFLNEQKKDIFDFVLFYDKSTISKERLLQYKDAELSSGVTLVGPHRDDFGILMNLNKNSANENGLKDVRSFGSRGQQRLSVLQLKILQLVFMKKALERSPLLLLDDIFSELDENHINLVMNMIGQQQTIITTTHEEFVARERLKDVQMIELKPAKF